MAPTPEEEEEEEEQEQQRLLELLEKGERQVEAGLADKIEAGEPVTSTDLAVAQTFRDAYLRHRSQRTDDERGL